MSSLNPYEPSLLPAEPLEMEWPPGGAYRDGQYLVLHHRFSLPPLCVRTGQPAETEEDYELVGGLPNDGSVPESRQRWYGDKVYVIRLPLSHRAVRLATWTRRLGYLVAICTVVVMALAVILHPDIYLRRIHDGFLIGALCGAILSGLLITVSRQQLRLESVARGYFWISQAPRRYLRQLPEWPVPRPSFWRQAFFGPAGVGTPSKDRFVRESPRTPMNPTTPPTGEDIQPTT